MSAVETMPAGSAKREIPARAKQNLDDRMLGIMAAFAVSWGVFCLILFTLSLMGDAESLSRQYAPAQVEYLLATPAWVGFSKAMTTVGLLCGAVYLLLRKSSAYHWFMISLFGTLLTMFDSIVRSGFNVLGGMDTGVNLGMVIVTIFLFWASYSAFNEGQLED